MKIVTVPCIPAGKGDIYQIASQHYDRNIEFNDCDQYAVLLPSYYTCDYTTHATLREASDSAQQLIKEGYVNVTTIDRDGNDVSHKLIDMLEFYGR